MSFFKFLKHSDEFPKNWNFISTSLHFHEQKKEPQTNISLNLPSSKLYPSLISSLTQDPYVLLCVFSIGDCIDCSAKVAYILGFLLNWLRIRLACYYYYFDIAIFGYFC